MKHKLIVISPDNSWPCNITSRYQVWKSTHKYRRVFCDCISVVSVDKVELKVNYFGSETSTRVNNLTVHDANEILANGSS